MSASGNDERRSDRIIVRDLELRGIIGINDWERRHPQDVRVNLELSVDTRAAAASDAIEDSLNYRSLTKAVIELVESSEFRLVEALAEAIARLAIERFGAGAVRVRLEKPGALRHAASVGVEIERRRDDFG